MIDFYEFGKIVIDGRTYTSDIVIFPDRVKGNWWRREGHRLLIEDIEEALKEKPEVIIVGRGYSELMEIPRETADHLRAKGIKLIAENTGKATEIYNKLSRSRKVVAALHLTC